MMTKKKSFWFHYNKPESSKLKKPQITLHFNKACHIVDNIKCNVSTFGRIRNSQPRWVVCGKAKSVIIENGIAIIS